MTRRRLVLHIGLPKTGSSALQRWCNSNRAALLENGINYPEPEKHLIDPKHQFLVPGLQRNELQMLRSTLADNRSDVLLLSTEGLTNHLYDFSPAALEDFRELTREYETTLFLVVREPNSWTRSYYRQAVLNPPYVEYHYATALRYPEFCALPRIARLTDTGKICDDAKMLFGAAQAVVARYEGDWLRTFTDMLGVSGAMSMTGLERVHISTSDDLVELVRQVNALLLTEQERATFLAAIQACFQTDQHMLRYSYPRTAGPELRTHKNKEILAQLRPENRAQAELVEALATWLNGPQGSAIALRPERRSTLLQWWRQFRSKERRGPTRRRQWGRLARSAKNAGTGVLGVLRAAFIGRP